MHSAVVTLASFVLNIFLQRTFIKDHNDMHDDPIGVVTVQLMLGISVPIVLFSQNRNIQSPLHDRTCMQGIKDCCWDPKHVSLHNIDPFGEHHLFCV